MNNELTAKPNKKLSWLHVQYWNLSNGYIAAVGYSQHYGDMVTQFLKDGKLIWQACNGAGDTLPDFAKDWHEVVVQSAGIKVLRPNFKRIYE